ncbi:MAG TPA: MBL fold metallo-hydrolase [Clostridiales bacterium]|nr:MBL fold metallo-hydrolase [Clostridiales bacterium]
MKIKVLSENTAISEEFACEHGLSVYLESGGLKILFDTGASDLFLKNAKTLGVDIADVDLLFLSHGHYDHGGGLKDFLRVNKKAKLYANPRAFGDYFALREGGEYEYIGLDKELAEEERFSQSLDGQKIGEKLEVLSNVISLQLFPKANSLLYKKTQVGFSKDDFLHEQSLIVTEEDKTLLITGCAHRGIVNILRRYKAKKGDYPDYVLGGFHLTGRLVGGESDEDLKEIAAFLLKTKAKYFTGHCTGLEAYEKIKVLMGDNLAYASAGMQTEI